MKSDKRRWERLKIHPYMATGSRDFWLSCVDQDLLKHPLTAYGGIVYMQTRERYNIAISYYVDDMLDKFNHWAQRSVEGIQSCFFGEWRQTMPHESPIPAEKEYHKRGFGPWCEELIVGWTFSLMYDDRACATRLARFPKQEEEHSDPRDWSKSHSPYLLLLASI